MNPGCSSQAAEIDLGTVFFKFSHRNTDEHDFDRLDYILKGERVFETEPHDRLEEELEDLCKSRT